MHRTLKRLFGLALAAALLTGSVFAAVPAAPENSCVLDEANVLSERTEQAVNDLTIALDEACGAQMAVLTVDFTGTDTTADYASQVFNAWGVGDPDKNNGVLLLLVIGAQDYYCTVGTGLEKDLPPQKIDDLLWNNLEEGFAKLEEEIGEAKLATLLTGEYDANNAILTLHAGAGGTEAQDWCQMLYRMYTRWAERHGYTYKILDYLDGDEAGLKSASIMIEGANAYGFLKSESGVHRLVRISPFDAAGRRHTSFSAVEVIPEITDDVEVEIRPEDIEMQVYRSSGAGGQHINKTSSAVRLIHKPTGTVVECQQERSQFQNRDKAMRILASRLYEAEQEKISSEYTAQRRSQVGTGMRNERIRTYNFPQGRVTDHRIGLTLYQIDSIMDGDLDPIIDALVTADQAEKLKHSQS